MHDLPAWQCCESFDLQFKAISLLSPSSTKIKLKKSKPQPCFEHEKAAVSGAKAWYNCILLQSKDIKMVFESQPSKM